jgi:hypothetical protein
MQARIVQVQPEPWPSGYGDAVAMLDTPLEVLAERLSLDLFTGDDNLGEYQAAAIQLPSGRIIGLLRHIGGPDGETEVHADSHEEPSEVIRELLESLQMPPSACSWLREHPVAVPATSR